MSEIKEYKCPACGGAMEFDSASQKMKCPYCDTEISIEEYEALEEKEPEVSTAQVGEQEKEQEDASDWDQEEIDGMAVYICQSCGGEIAADKNTGATTCPFCGNRVVLKGQFEGRLKPDYIIPFKLDKKAAKTAYYNHLKGKAFVPRTFKDENHIDEIVGVYVPFWLFDLDAQADITYNAERMRVWESGDMEYTEHEYFRVDRSGGVSFEHIPEDGSRKMEDDLMESLEPYQFADAVPFKTAYLAGYVADRYDVEVEECMKRAKSRVKKSAEREFRETVKGYHVVTVADSKVRIKESQHKYALYPVWILNTTWKENKYIFAMNGQTGKIVGDLPADKGAFWKYVVSRGVVWGAIIYILMWLFMTV